MKTTLSNLVSLSGFVSIHQNDSMPIKTAYKFNKIAFAIEKDIQFFQAQYKNILNEYAEKDENGEPKIDGQEVRIQSDKINNYNAKMEELMTTEIDYSFPIFTLDELSDYELSITELRPLMSFIEEEEKTAVI